MSNIVALEIAVIVIISTGGIPVRLSPEPTSPASGRIYAGEFTILDTRAIDTDNPDVKDTWVLIKIYDDNVGWLHWDYESREMRQEMRRYVYQASGSDLHHSGELHRRGDYLELVEQRGLVQ